MLSLLKLVRSFCLRLRGMLNCLASQAKTTREHEGRVRALRELKEIKGLLVAAKGEVSQLESTLKDERSKSSDLGNRLQQLEELNVQLRDRLSLSENQYQSKPWIVWRSHSLNFDRS
jgi:hypothetical protein